MSFAPTPEQQAAIDAFATGGNVLVEALAGTGKTSTLRLLAEQDSTRQGLYVAFNSSVSKEADRTFPKNASCRTMHSLAWGAVMSKSPARKARLKIRSYGKDYARTLRIQEFRPSDEWGINAKGCGSLTLETIKRFCQSDAKDIAPHHVPTHELPETAEPHLADFKAYIAGYARQAWADLTDDNGVLGWTNIHNIYLKIFALSEPTLHADFILYDEAQDANGVTAGIIARQKAQLVYVGDRHQQIYGWNGAIDAMDNFGADHQVALTKSFRFGQAIADEANKWLAVLGSDHRITGHGNDSIVRMIDNPDAILTRTNAGALMAALEQLEQGRKVAIQGGVAEIKSFTFGARALMQGETTDHPDLAGFASWDDVVEHVKDDGKDMATNVKLIETYGVGYILNIIRQLEADTKTADVVVSTAHKAKGREWDSVLIYSDFKAPEEDEKIAPATAMLLYVAVTRARKALDCFSVSWIDSLLAEAA